MGVLRNYEGPAKVYVGAKLLADATSVRITVSANSAMVRTMNGGRAAVAGRSRGATSSEVQVSSAIPVAGYEFDAYSALVAGANVRIVLVEGGKRIVLDAWIESSSSERGVDSAAGIDFTAQGGEPTLL